MFSLTPALASRLPAGEALPELLSEEAILALIARAAAQPRPTMPRSGPE